MTQKFVCIKTVLGRGFKPSLLRELTSGRIYEGVFVRRDTRAKSGTHWRVQIINNRGDLQTYDPDIFFSANETRN